MRSMPHRIAIMESTLTVFEGGANTTSWITLSTVWGRVRPLSSKEVWAQNKEQQVTSHEIVVRASASISNDNRLIYIRNSGNRTFDIDSSVIMNERDKTKVVMCMEEVR